MVLRDNCCLGKRRALIGEVFFRADQSDRAVVAVFPQGKSRAHAAFASANDDHSSFHRHYPSCINTLPASTLTG